MPECPRAQLGVALDRPEPGHFAIRLRSRGEWVPALIYSPCPMVELDLLEWPYRPEWLGEPLDRTPNPLRCRIGEREIEDQKLLIVLWQGARAVTLAEHQYLVARREWARRYDPTSYHARPVDLRALQYRDLLG